MIKQDGDQWVLYSKDGSKKLGTFDSKEEAEKREAEINKIKHAKAEESHTPEQVAECSTEVAVAYVPGSVVSFADYEAFKKGEETSHEINEMVQAFQQMVNNIFWNAEIANKSAALLSLTYELTNKLPGTIDQSMSEAATIKSKVRAAIRALDELLEEKTIPEDMRASVKGLRETFKKTWADLEGESGGEVKETFAESYAGGIALIEEAAAPSLLNMTITPIRPGPGNPQDRHYYPADMLQRNAEKLVGAKMYETDHRPNEKSTRTWVSTITELSGFADDGAPIMRVAVHDPNFAERIKNLQGAGLLERMECSLLAGGTARAGEVDGKKYKVVESITDVESVDWVTRAGAGGHALEIAENSRQGRADMADQEQIEVTQTPPETDSPQAVEGVAEASAPAAPESTRLSEVEVSTLLEAEKRLPAASRVRLAESEYSDGEAVQSAITRELAYLKEVTGSGQPFGLPASPPAPKLTPAQIEERRNEALDRVNAKYLGG